MLNAFEKKKIIDFIEHQYVDVSELNSYKNYGHPAQNFARFAEPDEEDWDLDEEYAKQGESAIECIEHDGLWEYTQIDDSKQEEAIDFIRNETNC